MKIKDTYVEIKRKNMNTPVNTAELYSLIKRVTNATYADKVIFEICEDDGFDFYEVSDKDGKILIKSGSGVGVHIGRLLTELTAQIHPDQRGTFLLIAGKNNMFKGNTVGL
jgi:hypothetical protein